MRIHRGIRAIEMRKRKRNSTDKWAYRRRRGNENRMEEKLEEVSNRKK